MALTDEDGDVVNDYDYDVFGGLRDSSVSQDNEFTFASEQVDESTDLQYLRARYYDTETGTFLGRDGLPGDGRNPQSQNRYAYALGNPALFTDPSGFCSTEGDFTCYGEGDARGQILVTGGGEDSQGRSHGGLTEHINGSSGILNAFLILITGMDPGGNDFTIKLKCTYN